MAPKVDEDQAGLEVLLIPKIERYVCNHCGKEHVRLWRHESYLICLMCVLDSLGCGGISSFDAHDMVGPFQPAIVNHDSTGFYGFCDAPIKAILRWKSLNLSLPKVSF